MDPHQRLFLETVYATMEDAGYGGGSSLAAKPEYLSDYQATGSMNTKHSRKGPLRSLWV